MRGSALLMLAVALVSAARAWGMTVAEVRPDKICYEPGERATFSVVVENAGEADEKVTLRCAVVGDLNKATLLGSHRIQVPAEGRKEVTFTWDTSGADWGYDVIATLFDDERNLLSSASETFAVTRWNWKVGSGGTYWTMHFGREEPSEHSIFESAGAAEAADNLCRTYATHVEFYSWEPSGFNDRTPDTESWQSGQGCYQLSKQGLKALVRALQKRGIWAISHQHTMLSGPVGLEYSRRHPEHLRYNEAGAHGFGNIEMLDLQAEGNAKGGTHYFAGVAWGGPFDEELLQLHTAEIIESIEVFGWDGLRSDGMPLVSLKDKPLVYEWPSSGWRYDGERLGADTPEEADRRTAAAWRHIKEAVRKHYPDFVFGMNTPRGPIRHLRQKKVYQETWKEWMEDGMRLSEEFGGATRPGHYYNNWGNLMRDLRGKQDLMRELGGIQVFGPCYPGPGPAANTLSAIIGAMQSHPWAVSGMPRGHQRFRMRFSGLVTAPEVQRVPTAEAPETVKVNSTRGIWWQDSLYRIQMSRGRERVVVHLINQPTGPAMDVEDKTPPPVQRDFEVLVKIPAGKQAVGAWLLDPDGAQPTKCVALEPEVELTGRIDEGGFLHPDTGWAKLTVPDLAYWRVVVFEFAP